MIMKHYMFTKKFLKRSFKLKFYVTVWSCNRQLSEFIPADETEIASKIYSLFM